MDATLEQPQERILQSATKLDIAFPLRGGAIPVQHGYRLFSALSKRFPYIHGSDTGLFGVFPIRGRFNSVTSAIDLTSESCLRIRCEKRYVKEFLSLVGKQLILQTPDEEEKGTQGWPVRVGTSHLQPIRPCSSLSSPMVLIRIKFGDGEKREVTPERFLQVVDWQLKEMGVTARPEIPLNQNPNSRFFGDFHRKTFEIKDHLLIGFPLELHDLSDYHSVVVQERGLGGKRSMGCGLFDPYRPAVQQ
jgi:CRISPR-associated protein Cas6